MTKTIKIECACGQHYAFDAEDATYYAPTSIACPTCGADGTSAANLVISQSAKPQPLTIPKPVVRLHVPTPAPTAPAEAPAVDPGHIRSQAALRAAPANPEQALIEARAKITWGDSDEEVVQFLMIQGYKHDEAMEMIRKLMKERTNALRGVGIRKILTGIVTTIISLMAFLFLFRIAIGFLFLSILALPIMSALYGVWLVLKGISLLLFPKSAGGDIADM